MSDALGLLLAEFGLDPARGGMLGTLRTHVDARIAELGLAEWNLPGSRAELRFVERVRSDIAERERLIHAITVRHSWFYRDPGQLDGLLERMQARYAQSPDRPLHVWIAGCAGGEEAWTIAMLAADVGIELRLRATDLDAIALQPAELGEYGAWSLRELPERLQRFIEPCGEGRWRVTDELRALDIAFVQHNLCDPPMPGPFDVICCRNVLIYFSPPRAKAVVDGLRGSLRPDGELLLGAGDMLFQIDGRVRTSSTARPTAKPEPARRGTGSLDASTTRSPRAAVPSAPTRTGTPAHSSGNNPIARPDQGAEAQPTARADHADQAEVVVHVVHADHASHADHAGHAEQLGAAGRSVETGDYELALERLAVILDADPLDAEAHLWVGVAQYGLGREQLAAEALRRARCLAPQLWPATLFAALTHERRGLWSAATRCWAELDRAFSASDAPQIEGTAVLLDALPGWRAEALALARQRISKHAAGGRSP